MSKIKPKVVKSILRDCEARDKKQRVKSRNENLLHVKKYMPDLNADDFDLLKRRLVGDYGKAACARVTITLSLLKPGLTPLVRMPSITPIVDSSFEHLHTPNSSFDHPYTQPSHLHTQPSHPPTHQSSTFRYRRIACPR